MQQADAFLLAPKNHQSGMLEDPTETLFNRVGPANRQDVHTPQMADRTLLW